jgi:DMSO/TMAO reductase YedYZ molybdopterin-dependent catalytic subunit
MVGLAMFNQAMAQDEQVIPWLDQPPAAPVGPLQPPQAMKPGFVWTVASGAPDPARVIGNTQRWEDLGSWITPTDRFFQIAHYNKPEIDAASWSLEVTGLVERPLNLTLTQLKARPRKQITCTIECSGNRGLPFLTSAVGNANWAGASLAQILEQAKPKRNGVEVVFVGHDAGEEIIRSLTIRSNFARSMSLDDAMNPNNMLCYEMNGAALPRIHGFPLRLIVPGWYGVASVKWLKRIEVRDTRFMGRFMARDYVTVREEKINGESFWSETAIGRWRLTSAPARVVRQGDMYRVLGMAWGGPISRVEVRLDGGAWQPAKLDTSHNAEFAWKFWSIDVPLTAGEHTIVSRAFDANGNVQPPADDPMISGKRTYWESNGQIARRIRI